MARGRADRVTGIAWRALLLAVLWWLITQGRTEAWLVGLPAVVLAALASVCLLYTSDAADDEYNV